MFSRTQISDEVSGRDRAVEQELKEFEEAEAVELRPSVEQEIQGTVDSHHPDARPEGMTLEAEERFVAREDEIRQTRQRWDRREDSDRERRTRAVASAGTRYAQEVPLKDPRELLSRAQLAAVNERAAQIVAELPGRSRAAAAYLLARKVLQGVEMLNAVLLVKEELQDTPGMIVPIADIEDVPRSAVAIEGRVAVLWESSSPAIQQVGLIEDESGRTKFTVWERSNQPWLDEGERVRLRNVEKNWYEGRVSVAVTGWSQVAFPDRGEWWTA